MIKSLHSGLRGNVSTYCLNTDDIASMMDAQLIPPSSAVLAATIGVTFVGPKNLPQKTMPGFLHVNCHRVHDTLLWLKENNPIYRDIVISSSRLNDLPLDGILLEISLTAKHCDDAAQLAEERDGYVPEDMDGDESYPPMLTVTWTMTCLMLRMTTWMILHALMKVVHFLYYMLSISVIHQRSCSDSSSFIGCCRHCR